MRTFKRMLVMMVVVVGVLGMGIFPAYGATFDVFNCNDSGAGSLRQAILNANGAGGVDDITFSVVCNPITLTTGEIEITQSVNIIGNGSVISGNDASRIFLVTGAITVTIDNLGFRDGLGAFGGAIHNDSATMVITNSTFTDNNSVPATSGGAIYNDGAIIIASSTFTGNSAPAGGGAILNSAGSLNVSNSTFTNNSAPGAGGGAIGGLGTMIITNNTFTNNSATTGGALTNSGTMTVSNSTFTGNSAVTAGGAIRNFSSLTLNGNDIRDNIAPAGGAVSIPAGTASSQNTHYGNNDCVGTITDNGGNTALTATGCPGVAPTALSVTPLTCSGDSAVFEILAGDGDFRISSTDVVAGLPIDPAAAGLYGLVGPDTWTNIIITELKGDREAVNIGGISCPEAVVIPPSEPVVSTTTATVLGCALDATDGVEIANAPDNTYCRVLMSNGAVVGYSGAVPADLISLGVIYAVDVYRLEGGASQTTFPNYARVCLAGQGRLFYLDARTSPRVQVELTTEREGNFTCGWIPAAGTLVLTN